MGVISVLWLRINLLLIYKAENEFIQQNDIDRA